MGAAPVGSGQGPRRCSPISASLGGAGWRQTEGGFQGSALAPGARLPAGRTPGRSSRRSRRRCPWENEDARAARGEGGGQCQGTSKSPGTFMPVYEAGRGRATMPRVGLQPAPAPLLPPPTLLCSPPHPLHPTSSTHSAPEKGS